MLAFAFESVPLHVFFEQVAGRVRARDVHALRQTCKGAKRYTEPWARARAQAMADCLRDVGEDVDVWCLLRHLTRATSALGVAIDLSGASSRPGGELADRDVTVWVPVAGAGDEERGGVLCWPTEAFHREIRAGSASEVVNLPPLLCCRILIEVSSGGRLASGRLSSQMEGACSVALSEALGRQMRMLSTCPSASSWTPSCCGSAPSGWLPVDAELARVDAGRVRIVSGAARGVAYASDAGHVLAGLRPSTLAVRVRLESPFSGVDVFVGLDGAVSVARAASSAPDDGIDVHPDSGRRAVADLGPGASRETLAWALSVLLRTGLRHVEPSTAAAPEADRREVARFVARAARALVVASCPPAS
jgi:hypothetical protein